MARIVCVCGGGNLGHVCAGFMAARGDFEVRVLTNHPERWGQYLTIHQPDSLTALHGRLSQVSSDPAEAVCGTDIMLLCLPGFAIRDVLTAIAPHLRHGSTDGTAVGSVVSSTGFFFQAMDVLPADVPLFGLQRVPFISRTEEYGHTARLMGYKESLRAAVEQTGRKEELRQTIEKMFDTPTQLVKSHYEVSLSNSNPLLHPARLYDLWHDWHEGIVYDRVPMFYEEWTEQAAQLYIDMDRELQTLVASVNQQLSVPTVLDYYESRDALSLSAKLRSIEAFKGIAAPMKPCGDGFMPDLNSRYFTEDFPYGLAFVHRLAHEKGVPSPTIDRILGWGMRILGH